MQKENFFKIIFIKLIIHIESNEVIQMCSKFKEDRIISF